VGRSLKEALLGQYAALQEAGLAPTEVPQEDETPLVVVESAPRGRATRPRRESVDRYLEADDLDANGRFDRESRRAPRREHRGEELGRERRRPGGGSSAGPGGARGRGRGKPGEFEPEFAAPAGGVNAGTDRPLGSRGPRPAGPMGPRPARPGMGAPRIGGLPGVGGPARPPSRTNMLQQRADQRRRDEDDIVEMRQLLAEYSGQEIDDQFMEAFSRGLAEETGALPPPRIVVEAIKESKSAEPRRIADAVRAYYRRPRPRPPMSPPPQPEPAVSAPA
jgi:hypothetical protein